MSHGNWDPMPEEQSTGHCPELSTAGFYDVAGSGRETRNFNVGWRFAGAPADGAESMACDDSAWPLVNLPHGLEILPLETSGGINYQGAAWYRRQKLLLRADLCSIPLVADGSDFVAIVAQVVDKNGEVVRLTETPFASR